MRHPAEGPILIEPSIKEFGHRTERRLRTDPRQGCSICIVTSSRNLGSGGADKLRTAPRTQQNRPPPHYRSGDLGLEGSSKGADSSTIAVRPVAGRLGCIVVLSHLRPLQEPRPRLQASRGSGRRDRIYSNTPKSRTSIVQACRSGCSHSVSDTAAMADSV